MVNRNVRHHLCDIYILPRQATRYFQSSSPSSEILTLFLSFSLLLLSSLSHTQRHNISFHLNIQPETWKFNTLKIFICKDAKNKYFIFLYLKYILTFFLLVVDSNQHQYHTKKNISNLILYFHEEYILVSIFFRASMLIAL